MSTANIILADLPAHARYLTFHLAGNPTSKQVIATLQALRLPNCCVIGLGHSLISFLGGAIPGLRDFPELHGLHAVMPATHGAIWCWLQGTDRGELLHAGREVTRSLSSSFELCDITDGFQFSGGRDLTGYEDGTENPEGQEAAEVAIVAHEDPGLDGSSFVVVQKWTHDLNAFESMSQQQRDAAIGRRRDDNEELADAPEAAHVKRTAQENFEPDAFVLRRSMPWAEGLQEGLMFVSFGVSFNAFEALARNMLGLTDGIKDSLFQFTKPVSGGYFWCPPLLEGRLNLRAVGCP